VKETAKEPTSLLHDFIAQQHANVFMRAFSFAANQLPQMSDKPAEIADRVLVTDDSGFIFHLREREQKVASKAPESNPLGAGQVVKKCVRRIQNTRESTSELPRPIGRQPFRPPDYGDVEESRCSGWNHDLPGSTEDASVSGGALNRTGTGGFVHILRDTDYFEICHHFVTPAELLDYLEFFVAMCW
jgi:hypothetical protein